MDALARRVDTSCEGSKQWYVCSAGNFRGCCASDPCTSGICFEDNVSLLHLTSAASSTSSTTSSSSTSTVMKTSTSTIANTSSATPSTTVSNTSSSTTTLVSSEASSTTSVADSTESLGSTTTPSSSSEAAAGASSTQSSSKGPIIGGVVGGLAAWILIILLLWFCRRRRKRHGKSYTIHLRRSPSTKSLHNREMPSVSKTELALLETNSAKLLNESRHGDETTSPPTNSTAHSILSTPGSTTALSLTAPTLSPDPSEFPTLSSGILTTSSGGFVRLPPLRMPTPLPTIEMPASIPEPESHAAAAAELSDTGFYRQRAELAAHSQSELINVPLERRRRKSPVHSGSSPSSSSRGSSDSSPRSAVDKNGSSPLITRATARRVVTRDGVVTSANLDRYSTVRDPERGAEKGGKKSVSDSGQEHVMSFMTFGGSQFEMVQKRGSSSPKQGNGGSVGSNETEREGESVSSATRSGHGIVLEDVGASPIGEAPPAYDAGGVSSPKQDDKSPSGTIGLGINRRG